MPLPPWWLTGGGMTALPLLPPDVREGRDGGSGAASAPPPEPSPIKGIGAKCRLPFPPGEGWGEGNEAHERSGDRPHPVPLPGGGGDHRGLPPLNLALMPTRGEDIDKACCSSIFPLTWRLWGRPPRLLHHPTLLLNRHRQTADEQDHLPGMPGGHLVRPPRHIAK
jgi:hypothetical protein